MNTAFKLLLFFFSVSALAQNQTVSGKIIDNKERPLVGANVYIDGTYDGATTNEKGEFTFETTERGNQTIVATALNYDDLKSPIVIEKAQAITLKMRASINVLDAVVITAGSFKAGDNSKASALKPLDIVTTAGSAGDIVGALQTLPGAQINGESGRLFVRGGESDETQTYIDGIRVAQPYGVTANNMPTRGRFSPFLFNGMTFSTGGYSAEFGDALSSVLLMNSISEPDQDKTEYSFMTVGLGIGRTKKWDKSSFSINTSYIDLAPYQWAIPQNADWNKPYRGVSGEAVYRLKLKNGLLKMYSAFDYSEFDLNQKDINATSPVRVSNKNNNLYFNSSYKGSFGSGWGIQTGVSFGLYNVYFNLNQDNLNNREVASHLKVKLDKKFSDRVKLAFGGDYFITNFDETFKPFGDTNYNSGYSSGVSAVFTEADIFLSKNVAMKLGARGMYNDLLDKGIVEPRVSLAFKSSQNGQFSLAYGDFHQTPKQEYLKYTTDFNYEKTAHYILNYMYSANKRTLRAEVFYKEYKDLVKYDTQTAMYNSNYTNNGFGYAKGLDVFWRDSKTIKNLDYWVSYSFIDSKRDFRNYSAEVQPSFVADHTVSVVGKYWVNDWKSQISITNSFATGRPYNDPNQTQFMNGKTKAYNSLSLSWAYLLTQQKILFFSVSNVLGRDNVFGYQYANSPDLAGTFQRQAIGQPADRFFFVGFFWTISSDKKANNLDNL
ncbi:TonB-dependent receptor [Flavobacterium sp. GCM10023249]|uniref:TonB-dependent receptor n=1 Tax=unclassified Flavobacterium TaxID=196869 RepID=UPI00361568B4